MTIETLTTFNGKPKGETVNVDYGTTISSTVNDSTITFKLAKIKTFSNGIDAMNYMNSIGWELINITAKYSIYTCFYKKELDK